MCRASPSTTTTSDARRDRARDPEAAGKAALRTRAGLRGVGVAAVAALSRSPTAAVAALQKRRRSAQTPRVRVDGRRARPTLGRRPPGPSGRYDVLGTRDAGAAEVRRAYRKRAPTLADKTEDEGGVDSDAVGEAYERPLDDEEEAGRPKCSADHRRSSVTGTVVARDRLTPGATAPRRLPRLGGSASARTSTSRTEETASRQEPGQWRENFHVTTVHHPIRNLRRHLLFQLAPARELLARPLRAAQVPRRRAPAAPTRP